MKKLIPILFLLIPVLSIAQDESKFGIKFSGFVKTDIFYDSRQTADAREGHFLLYPKNELLDINGEDINAVPKFNILSIQTRLKGTITGPDALGAKTSGVIEGAFFGNIASDINGFRLRHAFVKLNWPKTELLVGQYWHPMFVTSCFPGTVSFNTGAPFEPFSRNPQIRLTQKLGSFHVIASAMEQVDFKSTGPDGDSPKYLINAGIPELNLRLEYNSDKFLIGAGINHKTIRPNLSISTAAFFSDETIVAKTTENVSGTSFFGYSKLSTKPVTVKLYAVFGQMMYSMTMLGGYGVTNRTTEFTADSIPYISNLTYTPLKTTSFWLDVHSNGKTWQYGVFAGFSKNQGAKDKIIGAAGEVAASLYYARGADIDYLYRISPRVIFNSGKFRIAPEIEYTVAAYSTMNKNTGVLNRDEKGKITDSKEVANFRILLGVYYFF